MVSELIENHEKILGSPSWIVADTKYGSEECLGYLQDKNIKTAIKPETKTSKSGYFSKSEFRYDREKDCYICPANKLLKRKSKNYVANRISYKSNKKDCSLCPLREKCISGKGNFRIVSHYDSPCYEKAKAWYYSGYGKVMQKLRGTVIEGIMGQAKTYHGMEKTRFRGLAKVQIQFLLTATALNLKKMVRMLDVNEIKARIDSRFTNFIQLVKGVSWNLFRKKDVQVAYATGPIIYSLVHAD